VGDGADPDAAARLVELYRRRVGTLVLDVLPIIGLLAETAEADAFTEADAFDLRLLARCDAATVDTVLTSADWFTAADLPLPPERRERLLMQLDLHGIRAALALVRDGGTQTVDIVADLARRSGLDALRHLLHDVLGTRAHALRAAAAISELERIVYVRADDQAAGALDQLRRGIGDLRTSAGLHELRELDTLRSLRSGELRLATDMHDRLARLVGGGDAARRFGLPPGSNASSIADAARRAAGEWLRLVNDPLTDTPTRRAAATAYESCLRAFEAAN
jgi:hypothetical protein